MKPCQLREQVGNTCGALIWYSVYTQLKNAKFLASTRRGVSFKVGNANHYMFVCDEELVLEISCATTHSNIGEYYVKDEGRSVHELLKTAGLVH